MRLYTFALVGAISLLPAAVASAQSGGALLFDGGDQVAINTTLGNFGTGDFTVEFFYKTTSTGSTLLTKRGACGHENFFQFSAAAGVGGELDDNNTNYNPYGGGIGLNDGLWHHVAFTRTGGAARAFVDGVLIVTSTTGGATNLVNGNTLRIGTGPCVGQNGSTNFQGTLDELRLSSVNRYPGAGSFARPTAAFSPDASTLALYHFDEPSGQTVLDATGTNNAVLGSSNGVASDDPTRVPGDAPLPVELSSFTGSATADRVTLAWTTATERDNAGFTVVRDGIELADFRATPALVGVGTTGQPTDYRYTDTRVRSDVRYTYRLRSTDLSGATHDYPQSVQLQTEATPESSLPTAFALLPASPNPFNPTTAIGYQLPVAGKVRLEAFDALGRQVRTLVDAEQSAGSHQATFDAAGLPSGVYWVRLTAVGSGSKTVRVLLAK